MTSYRLRPSSSHRWSKCAAYPSFAAQYPEPPETDEAREGTCAAWLAQVCLTGDASSPFDLVGRSHKNGWLVTEEMAADITGYVSLIHKRGGTTSCENEVRLSSDPDIAGTLDISATRSDKPVLYVDDLKYGRKIVEVRGNTQLIIYAAAELRKYPAGTFNLVQLGVYQPRAFHPHGTYRKWVIDVADLVARADAIIEAGRRCNEDKPLATPGAWCDHCPALTRCAAAAATGYAAMALVQSIEHRDMTALELSHELTFLSWAEDIISARRKAVTAEGEARAKREHIPGYHMQQGQGNRVLTVDAGWISFLTGIDATVTKPATPAELLRRGVVAALVDAVSHRPALKMKLVPFSEDDIEAAFRKEIDT